MEVLTTGVSLAVVIGLVQLLKIVAGESRYAPLYALIIGVCVAFLATPMPLLEIRITILQGVIMGLSAAGLYSGAKTMLKSSSPTDPLA